MKLTQSLRLETPARLALVGSGGKTTALFLLAHELPSPVWVTATTHLAVSQARQGDQHWIVTDADALRVEKLYSGINVFTGPVGADQRTAGLEGEPLEKLHRLADANAIPLLVEADGSKQKPLKAPAVHEPPIPSWVKTVGVCVGLSGVGQPLTDATVHRAQIFSELTGLKPGEAVTIDGLAKYLCHPQGGLKNISAGARRVALLNQADTPDLQAAGRRLAELILPSYDGVLIANLAASPGILAAVERSAGIILAAGGSTRLGRPKQTLTWRGEPLIRHVARTALTAGLDPVIVVTGSSAEEVEAALRDLPVIFAHNDDWQAGQSSSMKIGLANLPVNCGSAVFLLSDQPQTPVTLVKSLVEAHERTLSAVVAPMVDGRRGNPVLFDRDTFEEMREIQGDVGGRGIFSKVAVEWLPWNDPAQLLDVDTEEDYQRLLALENRAE